MFKDQLFRLSAARRIALTSVRTLALAVVLSLAFLCQAAAGVLDGAVWFEREVGDGVVWRYYQFDNLFSSKQSISYMEVDLANTNVDFNIQYRNSYVGSLTDLNDPNYPRTFTSTFASGVANARAAINGTYFNTQSYNSGSPSTPWGGGTTYLKVGGSVIHTFDGINVNNFGMGILFNNKSDVEITRRPAPTGSSQWAGIQASWGNMMVCGPVLVESNTIETYAPTNDHANLRHPRSAVGLTAANKLILLTVDGRTAEAAGMSCTELATVMQELGCVDAINLDGGGSTTLWAAGEPNNGVVNYPSDNSTYDHLGERRCANALIITSTAPAAAPWDGRLTSLSYDTLSRTDEPLEVTAVYTNIGSETWTTSNVKIVPSRAFGRTSAFIPTGDELTFFSMSPASVATGETATFTINLTPPTVAVDTFYTENFALEHTTVGYFGPADNELQIRTTVRPPLSGAPSLILVQGTATGPNNQWYVEGPSGWANSSLSFTAEGVSNSGSQRYCSASSTGRYARFQPEFEVAGVYKVEVAFPHSTNSITDVVYTVNHLNGSNQFTLNQNSSGLANTWNLLGQFSFGTGTTGAGGGEIALGTHYVEVGNPTQTGNRFYSGAVRFDYVEPLSSVDDWVIFGN